MIVASLLSFALIPKHIIRTMYSIVYYSFVQRLRQTISSSSSVILARAMISENAVQAASGPFADQKDRSTGSG